MHINNKIIASIFIIFAFYANSVSFLTDSKANYEVIFIRLLYSSQVTCYVFDEYETDDGEFLIERTIMKLIQENKNVNALIEYVMLEIRKLESELHELKKINANRDSNRSDEKDKGANTASAFDEVKRSRKQLFSSGLQGVWGVPGKK